jgi:hypothetical protein
VNFNFVILEAIVGQLQMLSCCLLESARIYGVKHKKTIILTLNFLHSKLAQVVALVIYIQEMQVRISVSTPTVMSLFAVFLSS